MGTAGQDAGTMPGPGLVDMEGPDAESAAGPGLVDTVGFDAKGTGGPAESAAGQPHMIVAGCSEVSKATPKASKQGKSDCCARLKGTVTDVQSFRLKHFAAMSLCHPLHQGVQTCPLLNSFHGRETHICKLNYLYMALSFCQGQKDQQS